jgi:long-chain acyl-CoA synthetase
MEAASELVYSSLPALFLHTCARADFAGWHHRENGQWRPYPAAELRRLLVQTAFGLREQGFQPGQGLGIIAPSSPRWLLLDLAAQLCGGYTVPLFPNISSENFAFQIQDAPVHLLAVNDLRELDPQLREQAEAFPRLLCLSADSPLPPSAITWDALQRLGGAQRQTEGENWFRQRQQALDPSAIFSIIYTSGSTGVPKGVPLTHRNMLVQIEAICGMFPLDAQSDTALSVLPVAHVFERMAIYYFLRSGIAVWFADDPKYTGTYLAEIRPSVLTVVPRILEKLYEKLQAAPSRAHGPKKWLLQWAIHVARTTDPVHCSWRRRLLEPLVYRKMREALGNRFKVIVSGSSALNSTVGRFLLNTGFPVFEGYGLTECSPVVSACHPGHLKPGTVGKPLPSLELRISPEGEVQVRGESVFSGYHRRPDLHDETFTPDGFFRTGDQGSMDKSGYLRLTGRIKELLKTSTGKYVRPVPIELELGRHPLVEAAQVFANDRKYATALIFLNQENARILLDRPGRVFDLQRALQSHRVHAHIERHVRHINRKFNEWERVRKWLLVGDTLSVEGGLLTPTLKLRRQEVEARYQEQIDTLYGTVSLS